MAANPLQHSDRLKYGEYFAYRRKITSSRSAMASRSKKNNLDILLVSISAKTSSIGIIYCSMLSRQM